MQRVGNPLVKPGMMTKLHSRLLRQSATALLATAGVVVANQLAARWAEWRHPPRGRFMEVDGVRLHYFDIGQGSSVVLLHGNMVDATDYETSGLIERLVPHHRVIAFDRPGCGYSTRPGGTSWTAARQAALFRQALVRLGVRNPVLVGHSWGTLVALEMALQNQDDTAGLVVIAGYYVATLRPDVLLVAPAAAPLLGAALRNTVAPLFGWLTMPLLKRTVFAPGPITPRFERDYAPSMSLRPSQIQAIAADGAGMIAAALMLRWRYKSLRVPTTILAGEGDRVVFKEKAEWLHRVIPGSTLQVMPGVGHMLHHVMPDLVVAAIRQSSHKAGADR